MGRENDRVLAVRHLVELLDEDGALLLEVFHHIAVVDDLVADIDRLAIALQRLLDDVDGADDTGTKAAGSRQNQLYRPLCCRRHVTSLTLIRLFSTPGLARCVMPTSHVKIGRPTCAAGGLQT